MLKTKIYSIVAGVLVVGGLTGIGVAAAQNMHPSISVTSSEIQNSTVSIDSQVSSIISDSSIASMGVSSNVTSNKSQVSNPNSSATTSSKAVTSSKSESSNNTQSEVKKMPVVSNTATRYMLIDPKTGIPISGADPNYEAIQSELNAGCDTKDAGTVPPNYSKACQAALARIKAAKEAAASSTASK